MNETLNNFALSELTCDQSNIEKYLFEICRLQAETEKHQLSMIQETEHVLLGPMEEFLKEFNELRTRKRKFEKHSSEYESALWRYMAKKSHDMGIFETAEEVSETRKKFHDASIRYVQILNVLHAKKKAQFGKQLLAYALVQTNLFQRQNSVVESLKPFFDECSQEVHMAEKQLETMQITKSIEAKQLLNKSINYYNPLIVDRSVEELEQSSIEGYLFKKSSQRVRNAWNRRYFSLKNTEFCYFTFNRNKKFVRVRIDLRLCSIKRIDLPERRFCFAVDSPIKRYILQAESDSGLKKWILCLERGVALALQTGKAEIDLYVF